MTDADYENMSAFSCGVEELDRFLCYEVKECVNYRYLSAYCAYSSTNEIIAVFTLMNDALMIGGQDEKEDFFYDLRLDVEGDRFDLFKCQSSFPAINIGHLGILVNHQNQGIGTAIIDFVAATFCQYRQAGCHFVTVDAINNNRTIKFYLANGFSFQTNRDMYSSTRRMYRIL